MHKWIRIPLIVCLLLSLISCQKKTPLPSEPFDQFVNRLWKESMEEDYVQLCFSLNDPLSYGIDVENIEVSFGDAFYDAEDFTEKRKELNQNLDQLHAYPYLDLNATQQILYQYIEFNLEKDLFYFQEDYLYMIHYFNDFSGVHTELPTVFLEMSIDSIEDLEHSMLLLKDTRRYLNECLDYTFKQAQMGYLMIDFMKFFPIVKRLWIWVKMVVS